MEDRSIYSLIYKCESCIARNIGPFKVQIGYTIGDNDYKNLIRSHFEKLGYTVSQNKDHPCFDIEGDNFEKVK